MRSFKVVCEKNPMTLALRGSMHFFEGKEYRVKRGILFLSPKEPYTLMRKFNSAEEINAFFKEGCSLNVSFREVA